MLPIDYFPVFTALLAYSECTMDMHATPDKVLVKIGILYDNANSYLVQNVTLELEGYPAKYGVASTYTVHALQMKQESTEDIVGAIQAAGLSSVLVASKRVNCSSLSRLFQSIPFFFISPSTKACDTNLDYNRLIYLFPSDSTLMNIMLSAMVEYKWTAAAVLYEDNKELQYTFEDMQKARSRNLDITAFEAHGSEESITEKLIQARRDGLRTYILVCSYTRLMKIMTVARELRLSSENNHWFIPNVMLNPAVLHDFLQDGVHITFLHSPLITPLTLELLKENPHLNDNGDELFTNVILALVRIALKTVFSSCMQTVRDHAMYMEKDGLCLKTITMGGQHFKFCGPDNIIMPVSSTTEPHTTSEDTHLHAHDTSTIAASHAGMHTHGRAATVTMHDHGRGAATAVMSSMHDHSMAPTTASMSEMHAHEMAATTTASSGMHEHGSAATTTASSGMHGHGIAAATTASSGIHGHGMAAATTASSGMHGHGMAAATTASSGMHGHEMAAATTASSGMHGHGMATATAAPPTPDPGAGIHVHIMSPTAAPPGLHHHVIEATTAATSGMHNHGHGIPVTDTSTKSYNDEHAGNETDTAHGHVIELVDFDPACIIYDVSGALASEDNSTVPLVDSAHHGHHGRRKRSESEQMNEHDSHAVSLATDGHAGHDHSQFEIAANFDPCPYTSIYKWNYVAETCTESFFSNLQILDTNSIFIVEHVHLVGENGSTVHQLLAAGGYNGARGRIKVTYPPFKISHVVLPNRTFVVGVVWDPPWLSWKYDPDTKLPINGTYKGFLYDLLVALSTSMGFNFTFYEDSAIEFGESYNFESGDLESEMNLLFDNDTCDLFLLAKTIHGERIMLENNVGLTTSFQQPRMFILRKRVERDENVSIWQFLTPFKDESWVALYMSLLAVSLLMTVVNKFNPNEFRRAAREMREGAKHSEHMGLTNSLWFNFASLVEQSSQLLPYSAALKFMSGVWWFFVMLVVSAYTANMISFMTQSGDDGITTPDELVSQTAIDYGMLPDNPMLTKFLPDSRDQPYSLMWEQLKDRDNSSSPQTLDDALARVSTGSFIFIASFKELVRSISRSCDYDKVGDGFYEYQFGLPVPLGWQFLAMTNDHLQRLTDDGTMDELEEKWFGNIEASCEMSDTTVNIGGQLDLKAFIGMYVFLTLGVTCGLIVCIFETCYIKYGGMSGFTGKAKKYEFRSNHRDHLRPVQLMEKEFSKWTGGWDVMKHKPFTTVSEKLERSPSKFQQRPTKALKAQYIKWVKGKGVNDIPCCVGCGQRADTPLLNDDSTKGRGTGNSETKESKPKFFIGSQMSLNKEKNGKDSRQSNSSLQRRRSWKDVLKNKHREEYTA